MVAGNDLVPPVQTQLSFCTGGGGLDLGVSLACRPGGIRLRAAVEIEAYAVEVLASRMEEGWLDPVPLYPDLRTFPAADYRGVSLVTGGYPCQPFSVAGRRRGADDPRHLWPIIRGHVDAIRPGWCFFENVPGHLRLGFREVRDDLRAMGYRVAAGLFTAEEVGAPHLRERLFILADSGQSDLPLETAGGLLREERAAATGAGSHVVVAEDVGREHPNVVPGAGDHPVAGERGAVGPGPFWPPHRDDAAAWTEWLTDRPGTQPWLRRGSDGLAAGMERLHLLGNGVVPVEAAYALHSLHETLRGR